MQSAKAPQRGNMSQTEYLSNAADRGKDPQETAKRRSLTVKGCRPLQECSSTRSL